MLDLAPEAAARHRIELFIELDVVAGHATLAALLTKTCKSSTTGAALRDLVITREAAEAPFCTRTAGRCDPIFGVVDLARLLVQQKGRGEQTIREGSARVRAPSIRDGGDASCHTGFTEGSLV